MAFTYDDTLPSDRDRARLRLSDNTSSTAILSDAEIDAVLSREGYQEGCAQLAEVKAAKYSERASDYHEADVIKIWQDRAKNFFELAKRIRAGVDAGLPIIVDPDDDGSAVGQMSRPDLSQYKTD